MNNKYGCWFCNSTEKMLLQHHIIPRNFMGNDSPENLLLICGSCHSEVEAQTRLCIDKGSKEYERSVASVVDMYHRTFKMEDLTSEGMTSFRILLFVLNTFIPRWEAHKQKTIGQIFEERRRKQ